MTTRTHHASALAMLVLSASLAGCGGGSASKLKASDDIIRSAGANTAVLPNASSEAAMTALSAAQAVVEAGKFGQTINCPVSGTAKYAVTGGNVASLTNGVFDAGENYIVDFSACQGAGGAATVNGHMTLTIKSASAGSVSADSVSTNLSVVLPQRTVTLNGSSTLTQTVTSTGVNSTTKTQRWTAQRMNVNSERKGRNNLFVFDNLNIGRTISEVNGVPVSSKGESNSTLDANLAFFTWQITLATLGLVTYGPTGVVTDGQWIVGLPDDRIALRISQDAVELSVDFGNDGTVDAFFLFRLDTFVDEAG